MWQLRVEEISSNILEPENPKDHNYFVIVYEGEGNALEGLQGGGLVGFSSIVEELVCSDKDIALNQGSPRRLVVSSPSLT